MDNINKPSTLLYQELIENVASLINETHLPAFVIRSVFKDAIFQLNDLVERQYIMDKNDYNNQLSAVNKENQT